MNSIEIADNRIEPKDTDLYREKIAVYIHQLRNQFLGKLIAGAFTDLEEMYLCADAIKVPHNESVHYAVVAVPVALDDIVSKELLLFECMEELERFALENDIIFCGCVEAGDRLSAIFSVRMVAGCDALREKTVAVLKTAAQNEGRSVAVSVGPVVDKLELVRESYLFACASVAQEQRLLACDKTLVHREDQQEIQEYLMELFRHSDMNGIERVFRKHVDALKIDISGVQVLIERFVVLYLQNITNECMRLGITLERFESYVPAVVSLMQRDCARSVESVLQLTEQILKYAGMHRTSETNHLLNMAKDYIRDNLSNEHLDLEAVSDHVGLSRVYFCKLFHQLEGINFAAYLKKVRIEKAKQLLLTTNMKVYEVSNAVGYSHAKYFGHVFKDMVGQTPADYQRNGHANL